MSTNKEATVGQRIGQIRITGTLGRGGMGTVYSGFHERLQREVALKVISPESQFSKSARARFLREARILSRLNHPRICAVHDLVEGPDGDVLVLEKVEGASLRQRLEEGLSRDQALDIAGQLFDVLAAVHRQGIVHRDLKPANIMVRPDGQIKVLDFGVARAVEHTVVAVPLETLLRGAADGADEPDETPAPRPGEQLLTSRGTLVGTLRYMSPEQARGEPVTPASDIYTAGLILLEMLAGRPPFDPDLDSRKLLNKVAWGDVDVPDDLPPALRALIRRLTSLAPADRPSSRDAFDRLQGILDAPRRRRRRILIAATVGLLALLATGMTVQWLRASREAERARRSLAETREVSAFLEQLFQLSNPFVADDKVRPNGATIPAEELLTRGGETVRERFAEQPLTRARFMVLLGRIQRALGHFEAAGELLAEALELRRAHLPPDDAQIAAVLVTLGETELRQTRFDQAASHFGEALEIATSAGGPGSALAVDATEGMGLVQEGRGQIKEAEATLRRVLEMRMSRGEADAQATALTLQRLASVERSLSHLKDARRHLARALAIVESRLGVQHPALIPILTEIATVEVRSDDPEQAEAHFRRALAISDARLKPGHPLRGTLVNNLANLLDEQGRYAEAEPLYHEALAITERTGAPDSVDVARILLNLAILTQHLGRLDEAGRQFDRCTGILRDKLGERHPTLAIALVSQGVLEQERNHLAKAQQLYTESHDIFASKLGPRHPLVALTLANLGEVTRLRGRLSTSEAYYRRALAIQETTPNVTARTASGILKGLAITCVRRGKRAEAKELFERARQVLE